MRNAWSRGTLFLIIAAMFTAFGIVGCTAPTQKVAVAAEQIADRKDGTIFADLVAIAKQGQVDATDRKVRDAVAKGDADAASSAAVEGMNAFDRIAFLQVEHAKSKAARQIVKQFLWMQKGIIDILLDKSFAEAEVAKLEASATQPAS